MKTIVAKKKFLSSVFYDRYSGETIDKKECGLERVKMSYNDKTETMTLKIGKNQYECANIINVSHYNNKIYHFKDLITNQYYIIKNNILKGPFKDIICDPSGAYDEYIVTDASNRMYSISADRLVMQRDLKCEFIGKTFTYQIVKNDNGKYALADSGHIFSDFVFETPNIKIISDYLCLTFINEGNLHIFDRDGANHCCVENFCDKSKPKYDFDRRYYDIEHSGPENSVIKSEKATIIVDHAASDEKIPFRIDKPYVSFCHFGYNGPIVLNFETKDGIMAIYYDAEYDETDKRKYVIRKIPYEITKIFGQNYCLAKNNEGQQGIVDINGNVIIDFGKYEYCSDEMDFYLGYIPVIKNGKMGIFDLEKGKIAVEPFCKSISFERTNGDSSVDRDAKRFEFVGDNGLIGIVNAKGHIVIEPIFKPLGVTMYRGNFKKYELPSSNETVYINLEDKNLFAQRLTDYVYEEKIEEKKIKETIEYKKYDDSEAIAAAVMAGKISRRPVIGAVVYGQMINATGTKEKTRIEKIPHTTRKRIEKECKIPEEIMPYIHLETYDIPDMPLNETRTVKNDLEEKAQVKVTPTPRSKR